MRALVIGLGITGEAVIRQVLAHAGQARTVDDRPSPEKAARAAELGVELLDGRTADLPALLSWCDVVLPSPGVPFAHPAITAAFQRALPVWSEFELAAEWDDRPIVAITGTNGKTTVTTLITEMLSESGRKVIAAGNNDLPLVDALDMPEIELFVVEASSFRLQFTERFRPEVAVWLNLSPDHLDWHPSVEHYAAAKSRIWAHQRSDDIAVVNAEDPALERWVARTPARVVTFGLERGDYRVAEGALRAPDGSVILQLDDLPRRLPHEISNALAAAAASVAAGASIESIARVLRRFEGLPHRVRLVGDAGGVRWYDDSKATTPASVIAAVSGFETAVLIAGGKNKGLDLSGLRALAPRLRGVVAIGEAGPLVADTFAGATAVVTASSMDAAVSAAASLAQPGDVVLLSPACASQDWYRNYAERGDDFARAVGMYIQGADLEGDTSA